MCGDLAVTLHGGRAEDPAVAGTAATAVDGTTKDKTDATTMPTNTFRLFNLLTFLR
ncbi:hypothetical protein GCM10009754_70920 [Amycolatopsis minnesotensis]|uniref:Uncharacterized protein n=1 Tax=Amycolatopsis minnesotensis TaxID=337894 RepID=A0ABN2SAY9_9PSEU